MAVPGLGLLSATAGELPVVIIIEEMRTWIRESQVLGVGIYLPKMMRRASDLLVVPRPASGKLQITPPLREEVPRELCAG